MKARLLALEADCAREPGSPLGERVNAMMCLASFLGYIAFDSATGMPPRLLCLPGNPALKTKLPGHDSGCTDHCAQLTSMLGLTRAIAAALC